MTRMLLAFARRLLPWGPAGEAAIGDLLEERARRGRGSFWLLREALGLCIHHAAFRTRQALRPAVARPSSPRRDSVMSLLLADVRYAARSLRRDPGLCLVVLVTLALGVGANVALFTLVRGVLLRPLPYPEPDRLVIVYENDRLRGTSREGASAPDYLDLAAELRGFAVLGAREGADRTLGGPNEPLRVSSARVTTGWLGALGVRPRRGRLFTTDEERPGHGNVVLLGEGIWRERFGADPAVVGTEVRLDGEPRTVVGVLPATAAPPGFTERIWEPLAFDPEQTFRGRHNLLLLGRLAPGVALEQAQAELSAAMARLEKAHPDDNLGRGAWVTPLQEEVVGDVRTALLALMAAVGVVLLLACANVTHLLLARALLRERDLAVRASLGASPLRLLRLLLVESLLLGLSGGLLGVGVAVLGVRVLKAMAPAELPRLAEIHVDRGALLFALAVSLLTALVFGLLPAARAARREATAALRSGRSAGPGAGALRLRRALVVVEMALAVVLVVGAGLLLRSFARLVAVEPGFRPEGLLVVEMQLAGPRWAFPRSWPVHHWPAFDAFSEDLLERTRRLPGVDSVALAHLGPGDSGWTTRVTVEGRPEVRPGEQPEAGYRPVGAGYFRTLGVPLRRGRTFSEGDVAGRPLVAVVNEAFVRQHFPAGDPIGQRIVVFRAPREIVGVVGDVRYGGRDRDAPPVMYFPLRQAPQPALALVARVAGDPLGIVPALRREIGAIDPELALFGVTTASGFLAESVSERRFTLNLIAAFAVVALLLAALGVYGVLSHLVAERRREIGVRLALGAPPASVFVLVLGEGARIALVASLLGAVAALGGGRVLQSLLFGVGPRDPLTFLAAVPTLLAAALLASALPALRATRVDPADALRSE